MSNVPSGAQSSDSRASNTVTGIEDIDVHLFRNFIRESKSLGCSPEDTSAASAREVVSESFVDSLTQEEIDEIRNKLFSYWEQNAKMGARPKLEVDETKVALHPASDPKVQYEEAVTSFEDAKSKVPSTTEGLHDIEKLIETELKSIRETKLSEGDVGKIEVGKMRRSANIDFSEFRRKAADLPATADLTSTPRKRETKLSEGNVGKTEVGKMHRSANIDFSEFNKKAADLPATTDLTSIPRKRQLPILRKTDPLEIVLRIYECTDSEPAGTLQSVEAEESMDVSNASKTSKDQEFRKHLVIEMRILYSRLVGAPKERAPSILEETEGESSSSSVRTKDSILSSRDVSLMSPLGKSTTVYPGETTGSAGPPLGDDTLASLDSGSLSGLVNEPEFNIPEDAKKQSSGESGNSNSSTSPTILSDDTLSNISSLPTDTSGQRSSVSSLRDVDPRGSVSSLRDVDPRGSVSSFRDVDPLAGPLPRVPEVHVEEEIDDDAFLTVPVPAREPGPYLAVPAAPRLPASLDDSSENAEAEEVANERQRRVRSPREDENEKAPKRPTL